MTAIALGLALPATAAADGLPVAFDAADNAGIASLDGELSYATAAAGGDTAVLKIARGTGEIQRSTSLSGDFGVPLVAYDGTPSGLSADGQTLVLIRPRTTFPREQTRFAVLDAERLKLRDQVVLDGDFSFDALSPDGRILYVIRYPEPRNPTAYEVRAYDLERDRLLSEPIVDPRDPDEQMAGTAQTRAVGPGGRWAYTLYGPAHHHHPPFVHALDTKTGEALCIDLDVIADLPGRLLASLVLQPDPTGSQLTVVSRGEPVAAIDLETFEVSEPQEAAASASGADSSDAGSGLAWAAIAIGIVGVGLARALMAWRRVRTE
jgi:hypothetical protein